MKQDGATRLPYTVRIMYVMFSMLLGVFGIFLILHVVLPDRPVEQTPWELLVLGLILYCIGLTAYIGGLSMAMFNIGRYITFKRPSIHFYASCAICVLELLFFLYVWTH